MNKTALSSIGVILLASICYYLIAHGGSLRIFLILISIITSLLFSLFYFQERLLYVPVIGNIKTVADNPNGFKSPSEIGREFSEEYITTKDGAQIHLWRIYGKDQKHPNKHVLLFCHANAGNMGLRLTNVHLLLNHIEHIDIILFDYRSYGYSSTNYPPTEEGLISDAEAVYQYAKPLYSHISIFGRSLGGAVSIALSSEYNFHSIIIENSFTSIPDLLEYLFPFLNFTFVKQHLLRLQWNSLNRLSKLKFSHKLIFIGGVLDEIVPHKHMVNLYKESIKHFNKESVVFKRVENGTHNDTWVKAKFDDYLGPIIQALNI